MFNVAEFKKFRLDNLVDFKKNDAKRIFSYIIYLQNSVPIQPKTSNILPKFCQKLATTLRVRRPARARVPALEDGLPQRVGGAGVFDLPGRFRGRVGGRCIRSFEIT